MLNSWINSIMLGRESKKKVQEFLNTGQLNKVKYLQNDEKLVSLEKLAEVWGVGPNGALKLYNQGIKSVDELR